MRSLRGVNLNLLPVLQALLHHQNVTRAAESLHMSQSAVSDSLASLRKVFDDELLVRTGRAMVPTELARALLPQIDAAVDGIHALFDVPPLQPEQIERTFTIMTADSVMMALGPRLTDTLISGAPHARLRFEGFEGSRLTNATANSVDAIIAPAADYGVPLRALPLYDDEFVCVMRRRHPAADRRLTVDDYVRWPHARFLPPGSGDQTFEGRSLARAGIAQDDVVLVPHFALLPYIVEATDCLALLPRRLAERLSATVDIVLAEPPFDIAPTTITMYWAERHQRDPVHQWFRGVVADVAPADAAA